MKQRLILIASGICGLAMSGQAALVAHYRFDEAAAATTAANELVGTSGVVGSSVTTGVAGIAGNAYSFADLSTQAGIVDMGNASFLSTLTTSSQLTFSVWMNSTDSDANRNTIVFAGNDTLSNVYTDLGLSGENNVGNGSIDGAATGRNRPVGAGTGTISQSTGVFSSPTTIDNGAWHHLALTVNLTTADLFLYVDGVLTASQTMGTLLFPTWNNFEIGRLGRSVPTDSYGGLVDDVQVYDTALSASDVSFLFSNPGLTVAAVPEPSIFALLGLSGLVAFRAIRRKK